MLSCLDFVFPVEPDRISSSANSAIAYLVAICTTLYVSVRARELMPALAVCFSCVHCSRSKPTKQINLACYCLQMIRVNTGSHSAKMIYLLSFFKSSVLSHLIYQSMCKLWNACIPVNSISAIKDCAQPDVTGTKIRPESWYRAVPVNSGKETFRELYNWFSHCSRSCRVAFGQGQLAVCAALWPDLLYPTWGLA